jgi:hypothetical protein
MLGRCGNTARSRCVSSRGGAPAHILEHLVPGAMTIHTRTYTYTHTHTHTHTHHCGHVHRQRWPSSNSALSPRSHTPRLLDGTQAKRLGVQRYFKRRVCKVRIEEAKRGSGWGKERGGRRVPGCRRRGESCVPCTMLYLCARACGCVGEHHIALRWNLRMCVHACGMVWDGVVGGSLTNLRMCVHACGMVWDGVVGGSLTW